jgi:P pilus assembly chaperone PapD
MNQSKRKYINHFPQLFMLLLLFCLANEASASLTISPTRVVFEDRARTYTVKVSNRTNEQNTYRISLVNQRMGPFGQLTEITDSIKDEKFADSMIRFSPRQVTLKAGETQVVRVMLRKPKDLEVNEYRSHLKFMALPKEKSIAQQLLQTEDLSISMQARSGITIPLIVRHGNLSSDLSIKEMSVKATDNAHNLTLHLNRAGNASVYGDLRINVLDQHGNSTLAYEYKKIALYTPNTSRKISLQLNGFDQLTAGSMQIQAQFLSVKSNSKDAVILAEHVISI